MSDKKSSNFSFLWILAAALAITGCSKLQRNAGPDVMATVNGYKVLRSDVDKRLNSQMANPTHKLTSDEEELLRLRIIDEIVFRQLLVQRAEKLGLTPTADELKTKIDQEKAPYTPEDFQKKLASIGFTEDDFKQEIRRNLSATKALKKDIEDKITISDADVRNFYDQHKAEFNLQQPDKPVPPFEDPSVQSGIRSALAKQRQELLRYVYQEQLREKAEIHNYYAERVLTNHGG